MPGMLVEGGADMSDPLVLNVALIVISCLARVLDLSMLMSSTGLTMIPYAVEGFDVVVVDAGGRGVWRKILAGRASSYGASSEQSKVAE